MDPLTAALNGGEDYELLFTVSLEMVEKIKLIHGVNVIGHMTAPENGRLLVADDGSEIDLSAQGWATQN
jgi:thiamine-monophosphate kinase